MLHAPSLYEPSIFNFSAPRLPLIAQISFLENLSSIQLQRAAMAPDTSLKGLETLIQSATTLLQQLQSVLFEIHKTPSHPSSSVPLDALALAHDSASLIRAHSTKISLLVINAPFTPSAISTVLRELVPGPIPGLASAVQACDASTHTELVRKELALRCRQTLQDLETLIATIPLDGTVLAGEQNGKVTGVLWAACDEVVSLSKMGVGGFFVKKVTEWKDTLKDVMEELKEWGDDESDEMDHLADDLDGTHVDAQDMIDDFMAGNTIPADDPDHIRPRLETTLRRIRLVGLLYQAVVKRRLKKLPALPLTDGIVSRLDGAARALKVLPEVFEDLAGAFYELRAGEIDEAMEKCSLDAITVSEELKDAWDGGQDEFTEWVEKFQGEIRKD